MSADNLLSRLQKVKRTGQGRWMACCPAHPDRSASVSIRELDDGRVLVHCFAECAVTDVLAAIGLEFADLMPERIEGDHKPQRRPFDALEALKALVFECRFIQLCALRLSKSEALAESDLARLHESVNRLVLAVVAVEIMR